MERANGEKKLEESALYLSCFSENVYGLAVIQFDKRLVNMRVLLAIAEAMLRPQMH